MKHHHHHHRLYCKPAAKILFLFLLSFIFGNWLGYITAPSPAAIPASADGNWGLSFQQEGQPLVRVFKTVQRPLYRRYQRKGTLSDL